jgi:5'-nucleotidase
LTNRPGGSICTFSGRLFYPLDPKTEDVRVEDIVQSLSLKCRWTGQCKDFYSVAAHSLRVARAAAALASLERQSPVKIAAVLAHGYLHDAHEGYLADLASPIKDLVPGWRAIEDRIQDVILDYFGLDRSHGAPYVKRADSMLLWIEYKELFDKPLTIDDVYFGNGGKNLWPTYPEIPKEALAAASRPYDNARARLLEVLTNIKQVFGKD